MKDNAIVTAVRKARKEISVAHGNNLKKLVAHYQKMEHLYEGRMYPHKVFRKAM